MAYQFGVLVCIVVAATLAISSIAIGLWRGEFGFAAGVLVIIAVLYWFWDEPEGFLRRVYRLFRDGTPLAPYGFRKNATLGYWLGIPMIYVGHVITAGTLYVLWELLKRPVAGIPVGMGFGFAFMAYGTGIGLVESSYRLWARQLHGVTPGDPPSSPLKSVVWSTAIASVLIVSMYAAYAPVGPGANSSAGARDSQSRPTAEPAPTAQVELMDFIAVTEPGWTGEALFRTEDLGRTVRLPVSLRGSLSGGDTVHLTIDFPDSAREPDVLRFQLNDEGRRLNDLVVMERTEFGNGILRIVAHGRSEENGQTARVRVTFLMRQGSIELKYYIEQEAGRLFLRDEYKFTHPADSN
jgi:hypothetical protein